MKTRQRPRTSINNDLQQLRWRSERHVPDIHVAIQTLRTDPAERDRLSFSFGRRQQRLCILRTDRENTDSRKLQITIIKTENGWSSKTNHAEEKTYITIVLRRIERPISASVGWAEFGSTHAPASNANILPFKVLWQRNQNPAVAWERHLKPKRDFARNSRPYISRIPPPAIKFLA